MLMKDMAIDYGCTENVASLVEACTKEMTKFDSVFTPFVVSRANRFSKKHEDMTGEQPTMERLSTLYQSIPDTFRGNTCVLSCMDFLSVD